MKAAVSFDSQNWYLKLNVSSTLRDDRVSPFWNLKIYYNWHIISLPH